VGSGKFDYDIGRAANTSVVLYTEIVERDSQVSMTPSVCFNFCRSIPDMNFFGLTEGRTCYCEHYYINAPGSGACDLPCDGDTGSICGGADKSTLYQMHVCEGGLQADAAKLVETCDEAKETVVESNDAAREVFEAMQASGEALEAFAEGSASYLSQAAKVAAGPIKRSSEELDALEGTYDEGKAAAPDFSVTEMSFDERKEVEEFMGLMDDFIEDSELALAAAKELTEAANPSTDDSTDGDAFVNVMRQMGGDDDSKVVQAVCGGKVTGAPKVGLSYHQCATACDKEAPKSSDDYCWAFQYFQFPDDEPLCFLFSEINELSSYTCEYEGEKGELAGGADEEEGKLLQTGSFLRKHHKHHKHHKKSHKAVVRKVEKKTARKAEHKTQHKTEHKTAYNALLHQVMIHHKELNGGFSDSPQATCVVRFADTAGVTPEFKDGINPPIDRCFGVE